jgi:hypothetical protein
MWTDDQLSQAKYITFHDWESREAFNVGTIEISGANGGIYLMVPVPPFGGLSNDNNSIAGLKAVARVPQKQQDRAFTPRGMPVPDRTPSDQYVIHDYGNVIP